MNPEAGPETRASDAVAQTTVDRVWEHALHEEKMHSDRGNFFLVAEAMLFVFYATLDADAQVWALVVICLLGIVLTIMWILIARRQEKDFNVAVERLKTYVPEYFEFTEQRGRGRSRTKGMTILGWWVPSVIGIVWIMLIIEILTR